MAIQSGIGVGEAQIYDTSGSMNTYARLMQKQQLQRQAEQKALQDQLGKLKTEGLRDQDVPAYDATYNRWKQLEQSAMATKDRAKRMEFQMQARAEYDKLNPLVYKSAEKTKNDHAIGMQILAKPHLFSKEGRAMYNRSMNAPLDSKDHISDYTTVPVGVDISLVGDEVNKIYKNLLDNNARQSNAGKVIATRRSGEATINNVEYKAKVDPEKQTEALTDHYIKSDKYQAYLKEKYPENYGQLPEDEATKLAIEAEVRSNPLEKVIYKDEKPDTSFADHIRKRQYDIANPTRDSSNKDEEELYTQKLLTGIINGEKGYTEVLSPYLPEGSKIERKISKPTANSKGGYPFLRIDIPAVTRLVSGNLTVVREAIKKDVPIAKGDALNELNSIVGQYGTGLKTTMPKLNTVEGKGKGDVYKPNVDKSRTSQSNVVSSDKPKKVIKKSDIASKAKASGYTTKEYEKLLKDAGVTIE